MWASGTEMTLTSDFCLFLIKQDENNPFSESYQQREHLEKLRQQQEQMQVEQQQQRRPLQSEDQSCFEASGITAIALYVFYLDLTNSPSLL